MLTLRLYYALKPVIPRRLQLHLRRRRILRRLPDLRRIWPIDERAGASPIGWQGWPDGKRFALVLTHDVDTAKGQMKCRKLASLEENLGFRSSFNFVPERYEVSAGLRADLRHRGFEIGVHGLKHDGKLFSSRQVFVKRAECINNYLREWGAVGFRSPAMHHKLEWLGDLSLLYDSSTFDTDPFEPQSDGVGTIFPFLVSRENGGGSFIELPYTLPQDFTLFILMNNASIDLWKEKLDWLAERGGMALVNTHPDYMAFDGGKPGREEYMARHYEHFLSYVKDKYQGLYWSALPKEVAFFLMKRHAEEAPRLARVAV